MLLFFQIQACKPGFAPQGDFLIGQKVTKDPPKAGPSPALWNPPRGTGCTCVLLVSALVRVGSHRWLAVLQFVLTPLMVHASIARAYHGEAAFPPPEVRLRMTAAGSVCRTSCVAVVGAVACPARWFPGIALGDSGGASPSPTPINPRNLAMFRAFLRPAHQNCAARLPTAGNSGSPGEGPGNRSTILQRSRHDQQNVYAIYVT